MTSNIIRKLSVGPRIFGGFLFLVIFFAMTFPFVLNDHHLLVERLEQLTNVDKKADRLLLISSKRIESSRVNLMRFLRDYLPNIQSSMNDIDQAVRFLIDAEKIIKDLEQKDSVRLVIKTLSEYKSIIRQIDQNLSQDKHFQIERMVFKALKTGNDIGLQIEAIVEDNEIRVEKENLTAHKQFKKSLRILIIFYTVALVLGIILAALMGRSITQPVAELREGAEAFKKGHTNIVLDVAGTDELSLLAITFNQMTDELYHNKISLEDRTQALEKELLGHNQAEEKLRIYQTNFEKLIESRTLQLNDTLKMNTTSLKKEINKLLLELKRPEKYKGISG